ncbi:MAG: hypothetical protein K1000chlam3_00452 [Chlamydiae bacterium]|nr:hypothetical protein [Chlamydiota bacterium]
MKQLKNLKNVGKAFLGDLAILDINNVEELASQNPTFLFQELERRTGKRQDPCVWDVFAAIIHEARTGESTDWWDWTKQRKTLQKNGEFKRPSLN